MPTTSDHTNPSSMPVFIQSDTIRLRRRRWLRALLLAVLTILLLLGGGYWTYDAMRESLEKVLEQSLKAINTADAGALEHWIASQKKEVLSWTTQEAFQLLVQRLQGAARMEEANRANNLIPHPAAQQIREFLEPVLAEEGFTGYFIVDRKGYVLAADKDFRVGRHVPPEMMLHVAHSFNSGPYFSRPVLINLPQDEDPPSNQIPLILLAAPIPNENGTFTSALIFLLDPHLDFSDILSIGWFGDSGNTYAVDRFGRMLSVCRFQEDLRRLDLIGPDETAVLNLVIRDPGRKLRSRRPLPASMTERPLTRVVAAAIENRNGLILSDYRDYRGVRVYGAWKWFEDYDFAVITEMHMSEALGVIRPASIAVIALFCMLIIAGLSIPVVFLITSRMKYQLRRIHQIGQYELIEKLGSGGIGTVYRARHAMLHRPTAIKLLGTDNIGPNDIARFEREVMQTAKLTHPNTIEIYDFGKTRDGVFYYAMEFLHGLSLAHLIEMEGHLPPARAVHILRQVCGSLREAHENGLIHRDIKPLNIFICRRGFIADFVKVLDFGLVKELTPQQETRETMPDVLMGTPEYIAPERVREPGCRDVRSDLYSLGALAYNMLTGQETYCGSSREILQHILASPVPRPSAIAKQKIPDELDEMVCKLLSKNPEDRPASVLAVIELLDAVQLADRWGDAEALAWAEAHADLFRQDQDE